MNLIPKKGIALNFQAGRMRAAPDKENSWILYILKCSDGSFYAWYYQRSGASFDSTRKRPRVALHEKQKAG